MANPLQPRELALIALGPNSLPRFTPPTGRTVHSIDRHVTSFGTRPSRSVANTSRRHRCPIQPTTVRLPSIRTETRADAARIRARYRRAAVQPPMCAMAVMVALEIEQLRLQIRGRPEQGAVQTFAPNGANQPFNEGMGKPRVRHRRDLPDVEDAQIRLRSATAA